MSDLPDDAWYRSSYCSTNSCVEVAIVGRRVGMRDSKDKNGPTLMFDHAAWIAFLDGARNGEFDPNPRRS